MKLWLYNKLAKEYERSADDIVMEFLKSEFNKDVISSYNEVLRFITNSKGLDSSIETPLPEKDEEEIFSAIDKFRDKINYYQGV